MKSELNGSNVIRDWREELGPLNCKGLGVPMEWYSVI